jgi:hypothetical protein
MPIADPKLWAACQRLKWLQEGKSLNRVYDKNPFNVLENFQADLKLVLDAIEKAS